jgi:uncharacterized membrane protein
MWQRSVLVAFGSLFAFGAYLCLPPTTRLREVKNYLLYGKTSALFFFGGATVVLLLKILHLSPADFGNYKYALFMAFALICGLSFFKVRDLLAIRGLAVLVLFLCNSVLDSVYDRVFPLHNIFVSLVYFAIIFFITVGAIPYIFRDCMDKILTNGNLSKVVGSMCLACVSMSLWVAFVI